MHSVKLYSLGVLLLLGACDQVKTETPMTPGAQPASLDTQGQKISYLFGMDNARNIKAMEVDFDTHLPLCHPYQVRLSHLLLLSLCHTKSCQQLWSKSTLRVISSSLSSTHKILDTQLS